MTLLQPSQLRAGATGAEKTSSIVSIVADALFQNGVPAFATTPCRGAGERAGTRPGKSW